MTATAWHVLHGDWQAVATPQRDALLSRVKDQLSAHLPPFDPELLAISRLSLPFHRRREPATGAERGLDLYEIAIPESVDGLRLERWCFFLWDGDGDLRGVDWLSDTLHGACRDWGFDAGDTPEERDRRLDLFLRLFCAMVSGDHDQLGVATPFMLIQAVRDPASGDALTPRYGPVPFEPAPEGGYRTPTCDDAAHAVWLAFGATLFRGRFRVAPAGAGTVDIEMLDDDPVADLGASMRPLYVRRFSDISVLCRGNLPSTQLRVTPDVFRRLLADPDAIAAIEGGRGPRERRGPSGEALTLLARAAWGGPAGARPRLEVGGSLVLGTPGRSHGSRLWMRRPPALEVEVLGDLAFEACRFRGPVELRDLVVRGVLRGRDARFDASLALEGLRVLNQIHVSESGGANPFAPVKKVFPPVAVDLDAFRCAGDASLARLAAAGTVSLERAAVQGRLTLAGGEFRATSAGAPAVRADHAAVGASLDLTGVFCRGGASLKDLRVRGSVDLSGCTVTAHRYSFAGGYSEDGIHLDRSRIGGDLHVNRQHHCDALERVVPALIGGDLDLSQVHVAGSVEVVCVQVGDTCRLDGARIGRDLILAGLRYQAIAPADVPYSPLADLTLVRGNLTLVNARVGDRAHFGALFVGGTLDAGGLETNVFQATGSGSYRLPVIIGGTTGPSAPGLRLTRARLGTFVAEALRSPGIEARDLAVRGAFRLTAGSAWDGGDEDLIAGSEMIFAAWKATDTEIPAETDGAALRREALRAHLGGLGRPAANVPAATHIGGPLVVNNLRTRADVVFEGVTAELLEVSDSSIGGDLRIGGGPMHSSAAQVRLTGNAVEGCVELADLFVMGPATGQGDAVPRLDLSYTHARRGLGVGRAGALVQSEACDLTGFATEADLDLSGLLLAPAEPASGSAARRRSPWARYWSDLADPTEPATSGGTDADRGLLRAGHARAGGRLILPRGDGALAAAELPFVAARALQATGGAFRDVRDGVPALDVSNARIDSFDLCEPLPRRANLQNCQALRWEVTPVRVCGPEEDPRPSAGDESGRYLELLDRSWPFAQDIYARLERDYRDFGEQRIADVFLRRMGWRLWRWSYLRPLFQSRPAQVLLAVALLLAGVGGTALPKAVTALAGVPLPLRVLLTLLALLTAAGLLSRHARDALRSVVGVLVVAPLQLVYGFGVRWWLPLVVSALLLVFVTWPMLQDCRNLATPHAAPLAVAPHGDGDCRFDTDGQVFTWTPSEAFWRAVQYHVPVIPLEGFYHGEIQEEARPVGAGTPYLRGRPIDERLAFRALEWVPGVRWLFASPERYTRFIHLTSWLVVPFSLVFFAGRLQRKYRLQQG
jgi:hypothetical protein